MKRLCALASLLFLLSVPSFAQFGFSGIVYDPTNYGNAIKRYIQLQQQLAQMQQTYSLIMKSYNLAESQIKQVENLPTRYKSYFSDWQQFVAPNTYGNTGRWAAGANSGAPEDISAGYRQLVPTVTPADSTLSAKEREEWHQQYGLIEMQDASVLESTKAVADVRTNVKNNSQSLHQLEEDVMSGDSSMQSQTALLQKLNVANVILIHQLQDANRLLVSLLDLQTQSSAQQRWDRGRALNAAAVERQ